MEATKRNIGEAEWNDRVRERLVQYMDAFDVPRVALAASLQISPQRLNGWINDARPIPAYYLYLICRRHPLTADWLLLGDARTLSVDTAERLALVSVEKTEA